jgi:hypothetical protein
MSISERDRQSLREARAFAAAEEAAEQELIEAPIRAATERLNVAHLGLFKVMQERITTLEDVDENGVSLVWIDPGYVGIELPRSTAAAVNVDNFVEFVRKTPWYWNIPENGTILTQYLLRNGVEIASPEMYRRAALRLREYHLLKERPPAPEPEPPQERPFVNLRVSPSAEPPTYTGWDDATGEEREFTQREVDRMSADEYRRTFRVKRSDMILPQTGPGPMGYQA